jgi:16S rRNA (adenine1518-N6/adenine1519-N6)-dimethyltransferase
VMVQLESEVDRLLLLPPGAFRPAPEVVSALVRLRFRPPVVEVGDRIAFGVLVRELFSHRRKTLANALKPVLGQGGPSPASLLAELGIDPARRPETLHLAELARLADFLSTRSSPPVV